MTEIMHALPESIPVSEEPKFDDYFGFESTDKFMMPDNIQYIEFKIMNEGERAEFQQRTSQDLTVKRGRDEATVRFNQARDRHALIETSVIDWYLIRDGKPVPFQKNFLKQWLGKANPKIVDDLELKIRMANPWMQAEMTVEDIEKEEDRLRQLKQELIDQGKD
jgi:hypothetical protein